MNVDIGKWDDSSIYEWHPCILCGQEDGQALMRIENKRIVRCAQCGHVWVNPRLRADVYAQLLESRGVEVVKHYQAQIPRLRFIFGQVVDKIVGLGYQSGRILDVGCGNGQFMYVAQQRGFEAHGLDINSACATVCSPIGPTFIGTIEDAPYPDSHFDVIFCGSTFCHFQEPIQSLRSMRRVLRPGGLLVMTAIWNVASLGARLDLVNFFTYYRGEHAGYHFWTRSTLTQALRLSGFEPIRIHSHGLTDAKKHPFRKSAIYWQRALSVEKERPIQGIRSAPQIPSLPHRIVRRLLNPVLDRTGLGSYLDVFATCVKAE